MSSSPQQRPLERGQLISNSQQIQISLSENIVLDDLLSHLDFSDIKFNITHQTDEGFYCFIDHPPGLNVSIVEQSAASATDVDSSLYSRLLLNRRAKESVVLMIDDQFSREQLQELSITPITIKRISFGRFMFAATLDWKISRGELCNETIAVDPFGIPTGLQSLIALSGMSLQGACLQEAAERLSNAYQAVVWYNSLKLSRETHEKLKVSLFAIRDKQAQVKAKLSSTGGSVEQVLSTLQKALSPREFDRIREIITGSSPGSNEQNKITLNSPLPSSFKCHELISALLVQGDKLKTVSIVPCLDCNGKGLLRRVSRQQKWSIHCSQCEKILPKHFWQKSPQGAITDWNIQNLNQNIENTPNIFDFTGLSNKQIRKELAEYTQYLNALKHEMEDNHKGGTMGGMERTDLETNIVHLRNWIRYYGKFFS